MVLITTQCSFAGPSEGDIPKPAPFPKLCIAVCICPVCYLAVSSGNYRNLPNITLPKVCTTNWDLYNNVQVRVSPSVPKQLYGVLVSVYFSSSFSFSRVALSLLHRNLCLELHCAFHNCATTVGKQNNVELFSALLMCSTD